jgi:hypothetical protein
MKIETICLQWGFFGRTATKAGWRNMPYDKFLVWGEFFKNSFQYYNKDLNIKFLGHPNLKLETTPSVKNYILIAVQKELGDHIKIRDIEYFLKKIYQIIENLPNQQFILRTHPDLKFNLLPIKPKDNLKNLSIHEFSEFPLDESFRNAKMCIGISSTTVIESVALNCYPIYVKSNSLHLQIHDSFKALSDEKHVFEFDDLEEFIREFKYDLLFDNIKGIREKLYASNRILEEVIS